MAHAQTPPTESPLDSLLADGGHWRLHYSPFTVHYSPDPEHEYVWMVGAERQRANGVVWGAAYFTNSFGQASGYVYAGERLTNWGPYPQLYAQWTAGILYGYRGRFKDKVPLNYKGFSPGLSLSAGWQFTPTVSAQAIALGNSALMFQLSWDLK